MIDQEKNKPRHNGVTNEQLEVCASCDVRLSYDELKSENIKLKSACKKLMLVKYTSSRSQIRALIDSLEVLEVVEILDVEN